MFFGLALAVVAATSIKASRRGWMGKSKPKSSSISSSGSESTRVETGFIACLLLVRVVVRPAACSHRRRSSCGAGSKAPERKRDWRVRRPQSQSRCTTIRKSRKSSSAAGKAVVPKATTTAAVLRPWLPWSRPGAGPRPRPVSEAAAIIEAAARSEAEHTAATATATDATITGGCAVIVVGA